MPNDDGTPTPEEQIEVLKKEAEDLKEQNEKLKNKDTNFEKLRGSMKRVEEMSEEEKKQWTEKEQLMVDKLAALEQTVEQERTSKIETWKEAALERFAGQDEKTREKMLYHFDRLKGEAKDRVSIETSMREAALLANADKKEPTAISFSSAGDPVPMEKPKRDYAKTEEGQNMLKMMGHQAPKKDA